MAPEPGAAGAAPPAAEGCAVAPGDIVPVGGGGRGPSVLPSRQPNKDRTTTAKPKLRRVFINSPLGMDRPTDMSVWQQASIAFRQLHAHWHRLIQQPGAHLPARARSSIWAKTAPLTGTHRVV